ncbi:MAG: NAD(P)/FAD-dependent oxidoreductase [Flavobacteriales bacterium]|nr:NAD(P)/FAD-dependent oxidoreductase [Flavobacteriales bacterium]
MNSKHQIVVIGAGTGGLTVAAALKKANSALDVVIIDPAETHWYQPAWTLVGANAFDFKKTGRPMKDLIPNGVKWYKNKVVDLSGENQTVTLDNGDVLSYDVLVASPGIQIDLNGIEGLEEAIDTDSVCSNYVDPQKTWRVLQEFKGGNAVFTQPTTPIKCGGAPQKIMYLADDYFRKSGKRDKAKIIFATPGSVIFGVPDFAKTLMQVIARKEIILKTFYAPVKIDSKAKVITFKYTQPNFNDCIINKNDSINEVVSNAETTIDMPYDMLHLAPPQSAPDFIKKSDLANAGGWIDVNHHTMQHNKFKNVFGLGDAAALPTAKTGAAIRKQAPVVVENVLNLISGKDSLNSDYNGYSSCPLVTGYGKMVLAEFGYDNVRMSDPFLSKFVDTTKENWSMWLLKKYGLPYLYWNKMMKGNTKF